MRQLEPPRLAAWLLKHFGCSPNNAAVIGDLDERYRSGRSHFWYWQQVLVAIVAGLWKEVTTHRLLTLRGIVTGWLSLLLLTRLLEPFYLSLHKNDYLPMLYERMPASWFDPMEVWGYYGRVFQSFDWVFVSLACIACACSGSLVALLHRKRSRAMLMAFFVSRCIVVFPLICFLLLGVIYMPQYATVFLELIGANFLALIASIIPSAFFTTVPESRLQRNAQG
jgi:hypothetical protein